MKGSKQSARYVALLYRAHQAAEPQCRFTIAAARLNKVSSAVRHRKRPFSTTVAMRLVKPMLSGAFASSNTTSASLPAATLSISCERSRNRAGMMLALCDAAKSDNGGHGESDCKVSIVQREYAVGSALIATILFLNYPGVESHPGAPCDPLANDASCIQRCLHRLALKKLSR